MGWGTGPGRYTRVQYNCRGGRRAEDRYYTTLQGLPSHSGDFQDIVLYVLSSRVELASICVISSFD